eukprot:15347022-Ditylum_brightwellii.AAC.1
MGKSSMNARQLANVNNKSVQRIIHSILVRAVAHLRVYLIAVAVFLPFLIIINMTAFMAVVAATAIHYTPHGLTVLLSGAILALHILMLPVAFSVSEENG